MEVLLACEAAAGRPASQAEDTPMPIIIRLLVNAVALWVATAAHVAVCMKHMMCDRPSPSLTFTQQLHANCYSPYEKYAL